jgi:protein-tyrosine phosphatase
MAEAMLRQRLEALGQQRRIAVDSAGTRVSQPGHKPDLRAEQVLAESGCGLAGIKARQVRERDLERHDLVLAMDTSHLEFLRRMCPLGSEHKLRLILDYASRPGMDAVPDPYYGNRQSFELVHKLLSVALDGLVEELTRDD